MLFSVIVPIYNVEDYLEACIKSVLNQTFGDFELILVDDGSPDRCPVICDEYAKKDSRIKVIHQKNSGLAGARQSGIKIACGDYVLNLDSDDEIEPDTLGCAQKIISDTKCDIISFAYQWIENAMCTNVTDDELDEGFYDRDGIEKHILPRVLMDENMKHTSYYLAGKIIRRKFLLPHQLSVNPNISLGEDLCCVVPCYLMAKSVYISKKTAYLYTKRSNSISKNFNTKQIYLIENVINEICNLDMEKPADFENQICRYSCFMCFAILAAAAEGNYFKSIKAIKHSILNSVHASKIKKAQFSDITPKSRVGIYLMKKGCFGSAFVFLNLCSKVRKIFKKG